MGTREKQYSYLLDKRENEGLTSLGLMTNGVWDNDPKRMAFYLSRYKFVAKMLEHKKNVLEIGCGDAFGSRIVKQHVENLTVSDFDPIFLEDAQKRKSSKWKTEFLLANFVENSSAQPVDAIYLLDVFEHIHPDDEHKFLKNIGKSLTENGVLIIGIPSLESQSLIAPEKRDPGHVNCKSGNDFRDVLTQHFNNVFLFSMNDEVVHTGHHQMAHYLFTVSVGPK